MESIHMKTITFLLAILFAALTTLGQSKIPVTDKSPLDICYFPDNYPILKIQNKVKEGPICRVIYSRPMKNGRIVFGELIEFGKVWRLGANEATELELFRDAKINNVKVKKGRYTLYAIPFDDHWTIIINKENDIWGAFQYDAKKDITRFDVRTEKITETAEAFSMYFEKKNETNISLNIAWDSTKTSIPITF